MSTNEAAERLRRSMCTCGPGPNGEDYLHRPTWSKCAGFSVIPLLDDALAAERRATVEEFYRRVKTIGFAGAHLVREAMLDEEAAR